jgi:PknH-like extracellular domain
MRQQIATLVLAGACTLAVSCTTTANGKAVPADKSGPMTATPVAVSALDGLLLDPAKINSALGATSMKVWFSAKAMWDWGSNITDKSCLAIDGPAQDRVYTNTGWTSLRGQRIDDSVDDTKKRDHYAIQAVVAFPSAHDASAFYNSSVQGWPSCANRRFSDVTQGQPDVVWTVGATTNNDGTLSTSQIQEGGDGWACQRALTARNNVAIDIVACSYNQSGSPAIDIAAQIAAKVAKQ